MALYAKRKGYLRGAAVFGNDIGSQTSVPTLLKAYSALGGTMVLNQKITLGQTSYQPEVEQLIAAKPQVIFTEASPQANATYFAELQQLGHLIPIIGTDGTITAGLVDRDDRGDRQAGAEPALRGRAALRPSVGGRVAGVQQGPAGLSLGAQAGAVEYRLVHDDVLRRGHRHGAGRDLDEEHQPGRLECVHPGGHHGLPGGGGGAFVRGRRRGAPSRQEDRLRRRRRRSSPSTSGTTRAAASRSRPTRRTGTSTWWTRSRPPTSHLSSSKRPGPGPGAPGPGVRSPSAGPPTGREPAHVPARCRFRDRHRCGDGAGGGRVHRPVRGDQAICIFQYLVRRG